jgi:hypothetical protein
MCIILSNTKVMHQMLHMVKNRPKDQSYSMSLRSQGEGSWDNVEFILFRWSESTTARWYCTSSIFCEQI